MQQDNADAQVIARRQTILSPWVTLSEKRLRRTEGEKTAVYHSLMQADYVTVLALTDDDQVVLVEQYRPAVERVTVELPGGLVNTGEQPPSAAARELAEEAGFAAAAPPVRLGCLDPDTGRLENKLWCFLASNVQPIPRWRPEPGVRLLLMPRTDFNAAIRDGEFCNALHIAIVGLAAVSGHYALA